MSIKITKQDIDSCESNIFGNWIDDKSLQVDDTPFKHILIPNFLQDSVYQNILDKFPETYDSNFWKYYNPLEVKYALDNFEHMDSIIKNYFYALSTKKIIGKFGELFKIHNLEYDSYLHGAGIHLHPRNGRLNMHLDYEKHPYSSKQRRLNVIFYVNETWNINWNGDTQLWDSEMKFCARKYYPQKNTALVFETIDKSWHGVPDKINCPDDTFRKSLAFYYVSPLENKSDFKKIGANDEGFRTKAVFVKRPGDLEDKRMNTLFKIRPYRRIKSEDMKDIWPDWTPQL